MKKLNLGKDSIRKLLFNYLFSTILISIIRTIHSLIDGMFIGNSVSSSALASLNISFPVILIFSSISMLFGFGGSLNCSIQMGEGNKEEVHKYFSKTILLVLSFVVLFQVLYFLNDDMIIGFLGAEDNVFGLVKSYLSFLVPFMIFYALNIVLSLFVRNDSSPGLTFKAQIGSTITNVLLNGILIIGFNLGLKGAAIGTGVAQIVAVVILGTHFFKDSNIYRFRFDYLCLKWMYVKRIVKLGASNGFYEIGYAIVIFTINLVILNLVGSIGVTVFTITFYVSNIVFAVFMGVAHAMQPIASFNYGAKLYERAQSALKQAILIGIVFSLLATMTILLGGRGIVSYFGVNDPKLIQMSLDSLKYIALVFPIVFINIVVSVYAQSINKGIESLVIQLLRGFVIIIIVVLVLPRYLGFLGVMLAFPLAEIITLPITFIVLRRVVKKARNSCN